MLSAIEDRSMVTRLVADFMDGWYKV